LKRQVVLGSFGVVVLLVLTSFVNVVGVQSASSSAGTKSPLFEYKTKNAVHKTFSECQYRFIGRKSTVAIPLSPLENKEQFVLRFLQSIVQMDDATFNKLIAYCITHFNENKNVKSENIAKIITGLQGIRNNPESFFNQITNGSYDIDKDHGFNQQYTINGDWIPGCWLAVIFYMLFIYPILLAVTFVLIKFLSANSDCFYSISTMCDTCPCYRVLGNKYLDDLNIG
jgi:hypothetical protein